MTSAYVTPSLTGNSVPFWLACRHRWDARPRNWLHHHQLSQPKATVSRIQPFAFVHPSALNRSESRIYSTRPDPATSRTARLSEELPQSQSAFPASDSYPTSPLFYLHNLLYNPKWITVRKPGAEYATTLPSSTSSGMHSLTDSFPPAERRRLRRLRPFLHARQRAQAKHPAAHRHRHLSSSHQVQGRRRHGRR